MRGVALWLGCEVFMSGIADYNAKNSFLSSRCGAPVSCEDFYRDVFGYSMERRGCPEDSKANPIIAYSTNSDGKRIIKNEILFQDMKGLEYAKKNEFAICSLCSYSGRNRTAQNAYECFGFAIDLDGVGEKQINFLFGLFEEKMAPWPSYINNSGNGLHIYYLFIEPVPLYPHVVSKLQLLKHGIIEEVWRRETSTYPVSEIQVQGIYQGYRVVSSCTKLGKTNKSKEKYLVKAYKVGKKVDLAYLNEFVEDKYKVPEDYLLMSSGTWQDDHLTLQQAKEIYPEWYHRRIELGQPKGQYVCNEGLYIWWLEKIRQNAKQGNRYYCLSFLFAYAIKCNIEYHIVFDDALELSAYLNDLTIDPDNEFTLDDVSAAAEFYKPESAHLSIKTIETKTGIRIDKRKIKAKRNQEEHLKRARVLRQLSGYEKVGRPKGSKAKKENAQSVAIKKWIEKHPGGTKAECLRDLNAQKKGKDNKPFVSKPTVYKYFKEYRNE